MHVRRVALLEKEILTLHQKLSYLRFYCGVLFAQSLVLCVVFVLLFVFLWPLCCLSFSLRLTITSLVSCGHCVVCPSVYGLWSPLWYLVATVLSVLQFTAYDYPFGILWPVLSVLQFTAYLWYLVATVLSVLQFTAYDYLFGILWPLYCLSSSLRLMITPLVSCGH